MTAKLTPLFLALALLACGSPGIEQPLLTTETGRADRVVIAPLNVALRLPAELAPGAERVWGELMQHFSTRDRVVRVIEPASARHLWTEVMADPLAPNSPTQASSLFARRLASHSDYDLLVMPSLVMRRAQVRGDHAYWDGVRRKIHVRAPLTGKIDGIECTYDQVVQGITGQLAGASLYVSVLTPEGVVMYEGLGGLALLHEAEPTALAQRDSLRAVLRDDPFAASDEVREGIDLALERRVPRSARVQ